ncbi:unnamed protein product [Aureobasidium uvarum]|uniref:Uncharacterized protein n=1 Tax=Aureobasidium uvarum TaxID=2773716 RepID=A0A9N8KLT3_9PEZI|nr:unnamed protein product [Aureobasidium uvarum]
MPDLHTDDYIDVGFQLADRFQTTIDSEQSAASERKAAHDDAEYKRSLDRSLLSPTWLSVQDWESLQRERKLAQGFSVIGLRALIYAVQSPSFWQNALSEVQK